ncbi:14469_t:CDS:2, partial [Funneliformis geosporum]
MLNEKDSLEYLPIYLFLFLNEKGSSLYNAYDQNKVKNKLSKTLRVVIDIDTSGEDIEITENILNGLVIATSSDSKQCSYHILYALALLIDHYELKAFTKLVYTISAKKGCVKRILDYARVQPPSSLELE